MMSCRTLPRILLSPGAPSEKDGTTGITSTPLTMPHLNLEFHRNSTPANCSLTCWPPSVWYGAESEELLPGKWVEPAETEILRLAFRYLSLLLDRGKLQLKRKLCRLRLAVVDFSMVYPFCMHNPTTLTIDYMLLLQSYVPNSLSVRQKDLCMYANLRLSS